RRGGAPEPVLRLAGLALLEQLLALDQRAQPQALARAVRDRRLPLPPDYTLERRDGRGAITRAHRSHAIHEQQRIRHASVARAPGVGLQSELVFGEGIAVRPRRVGAITQLLVVGGARLARKPQGDTQQHPACHDRFFRPDRFEGWADGGSPSPPEAGTATGTG